MGNPREHISKSNTDSQKGEDILIGEEMKAWIRQKITESESHYAEKMKNGDVNSYTLAELKAEFNG